MSEQTIYKALRDGGLSHNGACAVMGNLYYESLLRSNNVEDTYSVSDHDYTYNVDHGIITEDQFSFDSHGYGLAQWTYNTRKRELYRYAKSRGVSISDESMQLDFIFVELKKDFSGLYEFLCSQSADLYTATDRVCREFENPRIKNTDPRYKKALYYCSALGKEDLPEPKPPVDFGGYETCEITVRVLHVGDKGRDVFIAQSALSDMGDDCGKPDGDFGPLTEQAVNDLKERVGLETDGVIDADVWQILFQ